jgi:hypothetical protein
VALYQKCKYKLARDEWDNRDAITHEVELGFGKTLCGRRPGSERDGWFRIGTLDGRYGLTCLRCKAVKEKLERENGLC